MYGLGGKKLRDVWYVERQNSLEQEKKNVDYEVLIINHTKCLKMFYLNSKEIK